MSRKSAPQSMTTTSSPSWAAIVAGLAVRQREEDHVVAGQGFERWSPRAPGRRAAPGAAGAHRAADPRWTPPVSAPISTSGWAEQQAQQLASGVPAGSGDSDALPRHVHDYTDLCMFMCIGSVRDNSGAGGRRAGLGSPTWRDSRSTTTSDTSTRSRPASARCWPTATPAARVPGCPDWAAADLLWHHAGVQRLLGHDHRATGPRGPDGRGPSPDRPDDVRRAAGGLRRAAPAPAGRCARGGRPGGRRRGAGRTSRRSASPTGARPTRR